MSEQVVTQLKSIVGGDANYKNMTEWAASNLSQQEISMFDKVMDSGDPNAAYFAINSLAQRYQDAVGFDGKMLTGKASSNSKPGFKSQAEMIEAMQDPRYDRDPAYRQEVMQKLESLELSAVVRYAKEPPMEIMDVTETHNEKAEKLNGRLAMLGVLAALGAYAITGHYANG